jgi:hypothetical protein
MSGRGRVKEHEHRWYPISRYESGAVAIEACREHRCIELRTSKDDGRLAPALPNREALR